MRHLGLNHVALVVSDLDRSKRFYGELFDMREFGDVPADATSVPLVSVGMKAQVTLVREGTGGELRSTDMPLGAAGRPGGIDHFGFNVPASTRLDAVREAAEALGGRMVEETTIGPGIPSLFVRDPDGYLIQVTRFPRVTSLYVAYLFLRAKLRSLQRAAHVPF